MSSISSLSNEPVRVNSSSNGTISNGVKSNKALLEMKEQTPAAGSSQAYKAPATDAELKENITDLLFQNGIDTSDDSFINEVISKHNSIVNNAKSKGEELDTAIVNRRLINFAKGLQYKQTEAAFGFLYQNDETSSNVKHEIAGVKEAIESFDGKTQASFDNAMKKQNDAFHQAAAERIELQDTSGDGKVSVNELIAQSVKDEKTRLGRELTAEEIKTIQESAINRVAMLDQNYDNEIDQNEMAAFVWATAKVNDTETSKSASDITYNEWVTTEETMTLLSVPQGELTQDEINKIGKFQQTLKNGYEGLKR